MPGRLYTKQGDLPLAVGVKDVGGWDFTLLLPSPSPQHSWVLGSVYPASNNGACMDAWPLSLSLSLFLSLALTLSLNEVVLNGHCSVENWFGQIWA